MIDRIADFTEAGYSQLLSVAKERFSFKRMDDDLNGDNIALWRHDVDFSPHRALALARIESERSLPATYFVLLSSPFYNALEPEVSGLIKEIASLGHDIGLHYDASLVAGDVSAHEGRIRLEADMIAAMIDRPVRSFSLHNPSLSSDVPLDDKTYAGLVNATAPMLRSKLEYCSDSNGFWRYRSLHEVVADPSVRRLYALTHAEWWTPQSMSPNERVERAIDGRAAKVLSDYRAFLRRHRPDAPGALDSATGSKAAS